MSHKKENRRDDLARNLVKYLLQKKGPVRIRELVQTLGGVDVEGLCACIDEYPGNFERYKDGHGRFVKLITKLSLCETHCSKDTCSGQLPYCTGLHVCKYYVLSNCKFAGQCVFGHDLTTSHNRRLLHQYHLDDASKDDIKFLLTNTPSRSEILVPKICKFYNVQSGCDRENCANLHLCRHYVYGTCKFGEGCRRSHNMKDPRVINVLQRHGIDTKRTPKEVLSELRNMVTKDEATGSEGSFLTDRLNLLDINEDSPGLGNVTQRKGKKAQAGGITRATSASNVSRITPQTVHIQDQGARPKTSAANRNIQEQSKKLKHASASVPNLQHQLSVEKDSDKWICLYNLMGTCMFKERCFNAHYDLPYQWMYRKRPDDPWKLFGRQGGKDHNLELEITYSEPSNAECYLEFRPFLLRMPKSGLVSDLNWLKERCFNAHYDLPYQWMYRKRPDDPWKLFGRQGGKDHNLELEITYSEPSNAECYLEFGEGRIWEVNFKTMKAKGRYDVKRLSTKSSSEDERHPLATCWKWSWRDQIGNWKEYGKNDSGYTSTITSSDIEQAYLARPGGQMMFATQGHQYILDFNEMVQKNIEYRTKRDVVRRPEFVDEATFNQKKKLCNHRKRTSSKTDITEESTKDLAPQTWLNVGGDLSEHFQINQVHKKRSPREYSEIENLFFESMPNTFTITAIERVENGDLWLAFLGKQRKMSKRSSNQVKDLRLFHGTSGEYCQAICRQGFDFRLSGRSTGTLYGKGSYFSTTAKYSDAYTRSSERLIFVVRVLVGEYTKGKKEYVRPPSKDPSNLCSDLYDSCVDDPENPKIYVIFDNNGQVYPEYVIKYDNAL